MVSPGSPSPFPSPPLSDFEKKVLDLGPEEGAKFCAEVGVKSAFPRIIKSGYHAINLSHYFTVRRGAVKWGRTCTFERILPSVVSQAGKDEVRAWTIKVDSPAPKAAGVIHTVSSALRVRRSRTACWTVCPCCGGISQDFEKGFIMAEVMSYDGTEADQLRRVIRVSCRFDPPVLACFAQTSRRTAARKPRLGPPASSEWKAEATRSKTVTSFTSSSALLAEASKSTPGSCHELCGSRLE